MAHLLYLAVFLVCATKYALTESLENDTEIFETFKDYNLILNDENFDEIVIESDENWLIIFYAPWCNPSKRLAPEWIKAAVNLTDKIKLGSLDCDANPITCEEYNVTQVPTIKLFSRSGISFTYSYENEAESIVTWVLELLDEFKYWLFEYLAKIKIMNLKKKLPSEESSLRLIENTSSPYIYNVFSGGKSLFDVHWKLGHFILIVCAYYLMKMRM